MSGGARAREKQHVFFYRDNYRRIARTIAVLLVIMLIQTAIIAYQLITRPRPYYFATTTHGEVVQLMPLSRAQATQKTREQQAPKARTAHVPAQASKVANKLVSPKTKGVT